MKKPDGFMLFYDRLEPMRDLSNEESGAIFKAIWEYAETGAIPDLSSSLRPYWNMLRFSVDRNVASYNETSIKNRYNRYRGEVKKNNHEPADICEWWAAQKVRIQIHLEHIRSFYSLVLIFSKKFMKQMPYLIFIKTIS